jgi:hypothetical protein
MLSFSIDETRSRTVAFHLAAHGLPGANASPVGRDALGENDLVHLRVLDFSTGRGGFETADAAWRTSQSGSDRKLG